MQAGDQFIQAIADAVYARLAGHMEASTRIGGDRLTYSESEAAEMLGIPRHVLKGARERGEIQPTKIGKGWRYSREILAKFANGE